MLADLCSRADEITGISQQLECLSWIRTHQEVFLQSITKTQMSTSPRYCLACSSVSCVMVVHRTEVFQAKTEGGCVIHLLIEDAQISQFMNTH